MEDPAESSRQEISIGEDRLATDDASWGRRVLPFCARNVLLRGHMPYPQGNTLRVAKAALRAIPSKGEEPAIPRLETNYKDKREVNVDQTAGAPTTPCESTNHLPA